MTGPIAFTAIGRWRVYFNRHGAAPLVWCVAPEAAGDDPGWEIAVACIDVYAPLVTVYRPKDTPDDQDGRPSAWLAVDGRLTVSAIGYARIEAT